MATKTDSQDKHALVLSGGGARAAYQVGALRHIAKVMPDYRPDILTGVSAGAINAVHLASRRGSWADSVESLRELWLSLETDRVYETELSSLLKRVMVWGLRLVSGGRLGRADVRGMVDNEPLRRFLDSVLPKDDGVIGGISENIAEGLLESLAIITTNYGTDVQWHGLSRPWRNCGPKGNSMGCPQASRLNTSWLQRPFQCSFRP